MSKNIFRVLVVDNGVKVNLQQSIDDTKEFLEERTPFKFQFDVVKTNIKNIKHKVYIEKNPNDPFARDWYGIDGLKETLIKLKIAPHMKYKALVFTYDVTEHQAFREGKYVASWSDKNQVFFDTEMIQMVTNTNWVTDDPFRVLTHELIHAFCKRSWRNSRYVPDHLDTTWINGVKHSYYKEFDIFAADGNRALTLKGFEGNWDKVYKNTTPDYIIPILKKAGLDVFEEEKKGYRYFTEKEVEGLQPEFVLFLDELRHRCGFPFRKTSGFRTEEGNKAVGGAKDSAHLSGWAADILVSDGAQLNRVVREAYKLEKELWNEERVRFGLKRFSGSGGYFHIDIDKTKPIVIWTYAN